METLKDIATMTAGFILFNAVIGSASLIASGIDPIWFVRDILRMIG